MSFSDLFGSGEHMRNLGHFAAIVNLAAVDGEINEQEEKQLKRIARKLDIQESEYLQVMENPGSYPIHPPNSHEHRLERIHDLFKIVFADHEIDKEETYLIKRYAIGLGFSYDDAEKLVQRSIQIFSGEINFEEYKYLLKSQ